MYSEINDIVTAFAPVSLEEMDAVKLMNRADTKFILTENILLKVLSEIKDQYSILEMNSERKFRYRTSYLDTEDYKMFTAHQNGFLNRYKVRYRDYLSTNDSFLEVKFKTNKGKTIKKRMSLKKKPDNINKQEAFLLKHTPFDLNSLSIKLTNEFSRLTLVHKTDKERVTVDFDLKFQLPGGNFMPVERLCIVEVKREYKPNASVIFWKMKEQGIHPERISKYCIGSVLLNNKLKYNQFKAKVLTINKLLNHEYVVGTPSLV